MKDILLLDKPQYMQSAAEILEAGSFVVKKVESAEDARAFIAKERFAVILADVDMTVESGKFWDARVLNARRVPVILTCAKDKLDETLFPIRQHIYDIILKPYKEEDLKSVVEQAKSLYLGKEQVKEVIPYLKDGSISFCMSSKKKLVGSFSEYIMRLARLNGFDKHAFEIKVAFEEILINAVLHGNKGDSSKKIDIFVHFSPAKLVIEVMDEGSGFDYESMLRKESCEGVPVYSGGGRGLFLTQLNMDEFYYEEGGRKAVLAKYLKSSAEGE